MHRQWLAAFMLSFSAVILGGAAALGHGGDEGAASLVIEPSSVSSGGTVLIVGTDLEPDDERILQLRGEDLVLGLGTSTTTAEGRLSEEVAIPAHLPAGVYQLEAIGDETLTVELQVLGSPEGGVAVVGPDLASQGPRDRGALELGLVLVFAGIAGVIGLFLVVRAEKLGSSGTS